MEFRITLAHIQIPLLPLTSCVTLNELPNFSEPGVLLYNRNNALFPLECVR